MFYWAKRYTSGLRRCWAGGGSKIGGFIGLAAGQGFMGLGVGPRMSADSFLSAAPGRPAATPSAHLLHNLFGTLREFYWASCWAPREYQVVGVLLGFVLGLGVTLGGGRFIGGFIGL